MFNPKNFMTYFLVLWTALFIIACDGGSDCGEAAGDAAGEAEMSAGADESCEDAAGDAGGDAGGETAGETAGDTAGDDPVVAYTRVVVIDTTTDINDDGTPGADICEVEISCDGTPLSGETASLGEDGGDSPICDGSNGENCRCKESVDPTCTSGIDRTDGTLAFDGDANCGDNYVSLGISGYLDYDDAEGLSECASISVTVTEKEGSNDESYSVALCTENADSINISSMMFSEDCEVIGSGTDGGTSGPFDWNNPNAGGDE
jgi:hypothetical protein